MKICELDKEKIYYQNAKSLFGVGWQRLGITDCFNISEILQFSFPPWRAHFCWERYRSIYSCWNTLPYFTLLMIAPKPIYCLNTSSTIWDKSWQSTNCLTGRTWPFWISGCSLNQCFSLFVWLQTMFCKPL